MKSPIQILPYQPHLKKAFYDINHEWISSMFSMEDVDEEILSAPEEKILNPGGSIWFAMHDRLGAIGVAALMKTGEGQFELTKMGVLSKARGLGAGKLILNHIVNYVKSPDSGVNYCYLLTNSACQAAIHLYLSLGFQHDKKVMQNFGGTYDRADVAMSLMGNKTVKNYLSSSDCLPGERILNQI